MQYPGYPTCATPTLARQPDGKLLIAGDPVDETDNPIIRYGAVRRLLTDGPLDGTFGFNGRTLLDSCDALQAIALDAQGRIVVAGAS